MPKEIIETIKKTADFEDEQTLRLFENIGNIKEQGFVTKEQDIKILKWKSPRPLKHYQLNSEKDFRDISELAFKATDEKMKMHILTALSGVSYPQLRLY